MLPAQIVQCHNLVNTEDPDSYITAAKFVLDLRGQKAQLNPDQGKALLAALFHSFLDNDLYGNAALLAWGNKKFNPEPQEVQRIWRALQGYSKNLFMGAASEGKSFNSIIQFLLDWCRDPENTNGKIISTSETHAQANAWSTLIDFHRSSIIPLPGEPKSGIITIRPNDKQAAMAIVAIPPGEDSKARLQGFHPLPRKKRHPKFGDLTRVRAFIDEAEKVAPGLWEGIDNLTAAENPYRSVGIAAATNPADVSSAFAQRAEPPDGWQSHDPETDFEWISKQGWHVVRLDAQQSENVKQKKEIYPGLQTYEGFMNYVRLGKTNPRYWTFGRGTYPVSSVEYNIIPPAHLHNAKKVYLFSEMPDNCASLDPAFAEGGDEAILTTGRYGLATGTIEGGVVNPFPERPVLQIEQQFPIQKDNTLIMASNLIGLLNNLHVRPEWFVMDKTGSGWGLYDVMRVQFGACLGIMWSDEASDMKILQEDTGMANEKYKGITSEMWFAFSKWLEYNYLKFAPMLDTSHLYTELTGRKYHASGKFEAVESKIDFKERTRSHSPDRGDSAIMLVHLCRIRANEKPQMLPSPPKPKPRPNDWDWLDGQKRNEIQGDKAPWIDFSSVE